MDKDRLRAQFDSLSHEELVDVCVMLTIDRDNARFELEETTVTLRDMRQQYNALVAALDVLRNAAPIR